MNWCWIVQEHVYSYKRYQYFWSLNYQLSPWKELSSIIFPMWYCYSHVIQKSHPETFFFYFFFVGFIFPALMIFTCISDKSSQSLNINNFLQQTTCISLFASTKQFLTPLNECYQNAFLTPKSLVGILDRLVTLVSDYNSGILVTRSMEHHMLTHSLHFNDYKSEIKWWK